MTEIEKFNEEVEKRAQELEKMKRENPSKYEKYKYEIAKKYVKIIDGKDDRDVPMFFVPPIEQIAMADVAIKMGKPIYEITGAKYDPNCDY